MALGLAPQIGPCLGAIVLRSDVLRKQLYNADMLERLPAEAYSAEGNKQTYALLVQQVQVRWSYSGACFCANILLPLAGGAGFGHGSYC